MERTWPTQPLLWAIAIGLGSVLALAGVFGIAWAIHTMWLAGTSVNPYKSSTALVTNGPFRYSRNPIYVADVVLYAGLALVLNSLWPWALLPLVLAIVQFGVIAREERYLEQQFGDDYRRYRQRVPPWL